MTRKALIGARILTQSGWRTDHALLIDRPTIVDVVSDSRVPTGFDPVRFGGGMLVPGLIDTQVNGGGAALVHEPPPIDGLRPSAEAHRGYGTTASLSTPTTAPFAHIQRGEDGIARLRDEEWK